MQNQLRPLLFSSIWHCPLPAGKHAALLSQETAPIVLAKREPFACIAEAVGTRIDL